MDLGTGQIQITLLDTTFLNTARYASIGPSSIIASGSSATQLYVEKSLGNQITGDDETKKWSYYVGNLVKVRSLDFSFYEEVTLISVTGSNILTISPLSMAPSAGWIIDQPDYSGVSKTKKIWKQVHAFLTPRVSIVSGLSSTQFTVGAGDIGKFFVDASCEVFNPSYSNDIVVKVTNVSGLTVTVKDMGFTPDSTYKVEQIGFSSDEGGAYLLF